MNIRAKVTLFTSVFLVLMLILLEVLSIYNIRQWGENRMSSYRSEAMDDVREHLKDLVDVAYETVDENYASLSDVDYLSRIYETRLHNILDAGETIIERYQRRVRQGELAESFARERAREEIRELRFDGGTGYIWINDVREPYPTMVMHPTLPNLEGQILDSEEFNNAQGVNKNLFSAFVEVTSDADEGYVDYLWPKPTPQGLTKKEPKLSYVRRNKEWGWIIGTGIYLDDAKTDIQNRIKETVKTMRYAGGTGYFWINDNSEPFAKMVMHPTIPSLDGSVLDDPNFNNALGQGENLFNAFVNVTKGREQSGFVDYRWPKPTPNGLSEDTDKVSYVRLHEGLGWIIGSGVYIDNIEDELAQKRLEIQGQVNGLIVQSIIASLLFIALAVVISHFFAGTITNPIHRLTAVANEISRGKSLDEVVPETERSDEIGALAKSIDRLRASVQIMMQRMMSRKD